MNLKELQELASGKALGALDAEASMALAAALSQGVGAELELAKFYDAAAALAMAECPAAPPPAALKANILAKVGNRTQASSHSSSSSVPPVPDGFHLVSRDSKDWQPGSVQGSRIKVLSVSRDMGYQVVLAELAPGTWLPEHDHHSSEELFILSGHLHTEGRLLGPGDFLHAEPGSHHHELHTPDGCSVLLIRRAVPAC